MRENACTVASKTAIANNPLCFRLQIIKGEGMPSTKKPGERGDLVLTFDVVFPKQNMSVEQKIIIKDALPGN
jgi:DnaJ-class molecular chaperone